MKEIVLNMSDIIRLLNGRVVVGIPEGGQAIEIKMNREDTSITAKGAIERIEGEWRFELGLRDK